MNETASSSQPVVTEPRRVAVLAVHHLRADGFLLLGAQRWADSEAAYAKAIALDDGQASAHFNLALAQANQGKKAEAAKKLKRAFELRPDLRHEAQKYEVLRGLSP